MKKKLLYGLMGLVIALSLVGFVSCDDDDDDDDDDKGGTASATYYGEGDDELFSSVKVTYNSSGEVTRITVTPSGGSAQAITSISSGEDEELGTYYYGIVTVGSTGYEVDVALYGGTWYYDWEELGAAISASTSDTSLGEVVVYYDSDYSYITSVTVGGTAAEESESDNTVWTVTISGTTYTLTITVTEGSDSDSTTATYTYETEDTEDDGDDTGDDTDTGDGDDTGDDTDTDDNGDDTDTDDDEDEESESSAVTVSTGGCLVSATDLASATTVTIYIDQGDSDCSWITLYDGTSSWSVQTSVATTSGGGNYTVTMTSSSTTIYSAGWSSSWSASGSSLSAYISAGVGLYIGFDSSVSTLDVTVTIE